MKQTITTILILITLSGISQTLLLQTSRARVKQDMHLYSEWRRTVTAKNYLEYQNDSICIGFRFTEDVNNDFYGKWICTEVYKSMPVTMIDQYIESGVNKHCWNQIAPDRWVFYADELYGHVDVKLIEQGKVGTFVFRLL